MQKSIDERIIESYFGDCLFLFYSDVANNRRRLRMIADHLKDEWEATYSRTESFNKSLIELAKKYVHPEDVDELIKTMTTDNYVPLMKDRNSYTMYFRYKNGTPDYVYEKVTISKFGSSDDENEASDLVFACKNVDEVFREKMREMEAKKQYYSVTYALGREYSSIYYVDIESGKVTPYNLSDRIEGMFGDKFYKLDYDSSVAAYIESAVVDSDKEMMRKVLSRKFVTSQLKGQDHFTWVYLNNEGCYCEMKCVRVSNEDEPIAVVMGFAVKDAEIRLELEEKAQVDFQLSLLDGLSRDYEMVWLLRKDKKMRLFMVNDNPEVQSVALQYYDSPDFDRGFGSFIDRYVCEEDKERLKDFVKYESLSEKVPKQGMYSTTFKRALPNGEWIYIQLCFTRAVGPDGEENIVVACRDVDALIREENRRNELYKNAIKERDLDGLTGIRNRYCYEHFVKDIEKMDFKNISVIYIDADNLHEINNSEGHDAGDRLIKTLAQLSVKTWGIDNSFRIGGDEFVIFAFDKDAIKINEQLEKLKREMKKKKYSISTGYCHSSGYKMSIQDMIARAEKMMYEEKSEHHKSFGTGR